MRFRIPTLLLAALLVTGCSDDASPTGTVGDPYPLDLSEPESLLVQLEAAYNNREIEPYATLLARDFSFRFALDDIGGLGPELSFEQDSLFTRNLFESGFVGDVRLSMSWGAPVDTTWEGEPVKLLALTAMVLDVEQTNSVTLRVFDSIQHFYFRPGDPLEGEDPNRYYLRAWKEIGVPFGAAVETPTWGGIKMQFSG